MPTIGIDFGASRLRAAIEKDGNVQKAAHRYDSERMPRIVSVENGGESVAVRVDSLKRLVDYDAACPETGVRFMDKLTEILSGVREDLGGQDDTDCALAVPACYSERQRSAFRAALGRAGFRRGILVNDTRAALTACREQLDGCENVLVCSWGASVFSVGLYRTAGAAVEPRAEDGDRYLGRDDLDARILESLVRAGSMSPAEDSLPNSLVDEIENSRRSRTDEPSTAGSSAISPELAAEAVEAMSLKAGALISRVLDAPQCESPDAVVMVGGMFLIPALSDPLNRRFDCRFVSASDSAVAEGALMLAGMLSAEEWEKQVLPVVVDMEPASDPEPAPSEPTVQVFEAPMPRSDRWADNFAPIIDAAQAAYSQGRILETVKEFENLHGELARFSADIYRRGADLMEKQGDMVKAADWLSAANRHDPGNKGIAYGLTRLCTELANRSIQRKNWKEVVTYADRGAEAIKLIPNSEETSAQFLRVKGIALYQMGWVGPAASCLEECVRLAPGESKYRDELETIRAAAQRTVPASQQDTYRRTTRKVGPNEMCPCGSNKKYKKCCGLKERG